jgi:hypothetical protein
VADWRRVPVGVVITTALVATALVIPACVARVAYVAMHPNEDSPWWKVL